MIEYSIKPYQNQRKRSGIAPKSSKFTQNALNVLNRTRTVSKTINRWEAGVLEAREQFRPQHLLGPERSEEFPKTFSEKTFSGGNREMMPKHMLSASRTIISEFSALKK